eukprot:Gb_27741 [translate_table: standard]
MKIERNQKSHVAVMYSSLLTLRLGRRVSFASFIFYRCKSGSGFRNNGHEVEQLGLGEKLNQTDQNTYENGGKNKFPMKKLDQDDQNTCLNGAKSETPMQNLEQEDQNSCENETTLQRTEDTDNDLDVSPFQEADETENPCGRLGFEENLKGFPGSNEHPIFFTDVESEEKIDFEEYNETTNDNGGNDSSSSKVYGRLGSEANVIYEILQRDGHGFDVKEALQQTGIRITVPLVRLVLMRISRFINSSNKIRSAKLGFKFFVWAGQQEGYKHNPDTYNLLAKIFADCEELKAMWRLVEEMMSSGCPVTARTFNILLCSCGQAGMPRKVVEKFIRSKFFNYRPYKHSYNAILHALLKENQFKLIEWVYRQMLNDGHSPDILTYNIMIYAKYRLGKIHQFHRLLEEMGKNGFAPDLHTYNVLLHVLGKGDKPLAALNLLNYMTEAGCCPRVIHFTALIDGLSRAGNLIACKYFFEEMVKKDCHPDVVCYTVMITGYIMAGELEKAQAIYDEMIQKGQLPNVFTYNAMIQGLCSAGRFEEAYGLLEVMESRGCNPNFVVYSTLVKKLRSARKFTEAQEIMNQMVKKGHYAHLVTKLKGYKK